jgi:heptosyltransferase-2
VWPFSDKHIGEREFERIVVRVPNPLGDQIMATPALAAIRRRYEGARIVGHGVANAERLYRGMDWYDEFLVSGRRDPALKQARLLREGRFELCLLLTGSFRTAVPPLFARIPHRVGYQWSGRTLFLTAHWPRPKPGGKRQPYPTKSYFLDLVAKLGAMGGGRVHLVLTDDERERGAAWRREAGVADDESLLLMCVGAGFGPSKIWPAEYFAEVADVMARRHGARVILVCAPGEEAVGARVKAHANVPLVDTWTTPLDVGTLKALIARARVLLTNDTGPRHIAAAFRIPLVCLMGPTSPVYTETDTEHQVILRREDVECSPCHLKECPIDHRCMLWIKPEHAITAVDRVWNTSPSSAS